MSKDTKTNNQAKGVFKRRAHLFHVIEPGYLPFFTCWALFFLALSLISVFSRTENAVWFFISALFLLVSCLLYWSVKITWESEHYHTMVVQNGLIMGFYLFLLSEIMLFFALFWAFFHFTLSPAIEFAFLVPAPGIELMNPLKIPLFNTCLLVWSSVCLTLSHKAIQKNQEATCLKTLYLTIILGFLFLFLQIKEYNDCAFEISDGAFASSFYLLTGLHGSHVLVGGLLLVHSVWRLKNYKFEKKRHHGFYLACVYWHFVDVIWLVVYTFVYLWLWFGVVVLQTLFTLIFLAVYAKIFVSYR